MGVPHKHAELIKAWADGAEIQYWSARADGWVTAVDPNWSEDIGFRIKPEPKPNVVKYVGFQSDDCIADDNDLVNGFFSATKEHFCVNHWQYQLKLTFDGETGKLKSAEIIS